MSAVTIALPYAKEVSKGVTIGTAYAWGAGLGGIARASPRAAAVLEFVGAVGGLIGAMVAPPGVNDACEGIAAGSGALLGFSLAAPTAAKRVIRARGELEAKGKVERLLLKGAGAAKDIVVQGVGAGALVGAGLE